MIVKLDHFPRDRGENKRPLKPHRFRTRVFFGPKNPVFPGGNCRLERPNNYRLVVWRIQDDSSSKGIHDLSSGTLLVDNMGTLYIGKAMGEFHYQLFMTCFLQKMDS